MDDLQKQIEAQWRAYGINPDIKGINRANELAQILANYGISDLSKLGIKQTPYEEMRGSSIGQGEDAQYIEELYKGNRGQLTYGDQTFGRLGGFGSGGEKEFATPQEFLTEAGNGRYGLSYSAAGKGWTDYEVVVRPDGTPVIVPKWGSSSDVTPELIQFLSIAAMPFTGGLSSALGSTLGSQVAGQIASQALISGGLGGLSSVAQGGSFGKGFGKGAVAGGIGAAAGPYLGSLGSEAGKFVGGGNFGDIVSGAVQGAGKGALGAVITGDSVLDAILTGATSGAAGAGTDLLIKGTNSTLGEYLKDVPAPIKNAVLSAASAGILGKDIDKAVVNSFMRDMMGQFKEAAKKSPTAGQAASAGYGGAETEGFFDAEKEGTPNKYYTGLENVFSDWDEADIIPDTYDTAPKTTMSPNDMAKFLEANIDDPGTIETIMQDLFPDLSRQTITTTAKKEEPGLTPGRSIRDVGPVTQIQPGEKLEGTDITEPDLSKNLPTVPGKVKLPTKPTTPPSTDTQSFTTPRTPGQPTVYNPVFADVPEFDPGSMFQLADRTGMSLDDLLKILRG